MTTILKGQDQAFRAKDIPVAKDWDKFTKDFKAKCRKNKGVGRIMFPSVHDITPLTLDYCIKALKHMLEFEGNNFEFLIVTKPRIDCVKRLCKELEDYKDRILFRFTIGSADDAVLKFWEPGASSFAERLDCVKFAYNDGFKTSISIEPRLDANTDTVIETVYPYVTDSIWLGSANKMKFRLKMNGCADEVHFKAAEVLEALNGEGKVKKLYAKWGNDRKIKWKETLKKILGLPIGMTEGIDAEESEFKEKENRKDMTMIKPMDTVTDMEPNTVPEKAITPADKERLKHLEKILDTSLLRFVEVGLALKEINDKKFYKIYADTFEEYMGMRFKLTARHGYNLISSAQTAIQIDDYNEFDDDPVRIFDNQGTHLARRLITNERQARAFRGLVPGDKRKAANEAFERAEREKIHLTAEIFEEEAKKYRKPTKPKKTDLEKAREKTDKFLGEADKIFQKVIEEYPSCKEKSEFIDTHIHFFEQRLEYLRKCRDRENGKKCEPLVHKEDAKR